MGRRQAKEKLKKGGEQATRGSSGGAKERRRTS
jgi:hypothetical protein